MRMSMSVLRWSAPLLLAFTALDAAAAIPPSVRDGAIQWLLDQVDAQGRVGAVPGRDAPESVLALSSVNDPRVDWVTAFLVQEQRNLCTSHDAMARIAVALAGRAPLAASQLVQRLLEGTGVDNGWGFHKGYPSAELDTILAVRALGTVPGTADAQLLAAISRMLGFQRPDGGFGHPENDSDVAVTAEALITLAVHAQRFNLVGPMDRARQWLASQRAGDGHFGTGDGAVEQTVLAHLALSLTGGSDTATETWLLSQVDADGSLNAEVHATALLIRLADMSRPNVGLVPGSFDVGPAVTVVGEPRVLQARVRNNSVAAVGPVVVRFSRTDGTNQTLIGETTIPSLGGRAVIGASVAWNTGTFFGDARLVVQVDPANALGDANPTDNTLSASARVAHAPPSGVTANVDTTTVTLGWAAVPGTQVVGYRVYRDDVLVAPLLTGTTFVDSGLTADQPYIYQLSTVGAGDIEGPRSVRYRVVPRPPPAGVDLYPLGLEFSIGGGATIRFAVGNGGRQDAPATTLSAYVRRDGSANADLLFTQAVAAIPGLQSITVERQWLPPAQPGSYDLTLVLDASNVVVEADESNNQANGFFIIQAPPPGTGEPSPLPGTSVTRVADATAGCRFTPEDDPPADPSRIEVFMSGNAIARDATHQDGWDFDPQSGVITFYGAACTDPAAGARDNAADISMRWTHTPATTTDPCVVNATGQLPGDLANLTVLVKGNTVPRDATRTNGWDALNGLITFYGAACTDPQNGAQSANGDITLVVSGGAPSAAADPPAGCTMQISGAIPQDPNALVVTVAGQVVPRDVTHSNGWDIDPPTGVLSFFGAACTDAARGAQDPTHTVSLGVVSTPGTGGSPTPTPQPGGGGGPVTSLPPPDVWVDSREFSTEPSQFTLVEGVPFTLRGRIKNRAPGEGTQILVNVYDGNPATGLATLLANHMVVQLDAFGDAAFEVPGLTLTPGQHELYIVGDADNRIAEENEFNNADWIVVEVEGLLPVLKLRGVFVANPPSAEYGALLTMTTSLRNVGNRDLGNLTLHTSVVFTETNTEVFAQDTPVGELPRRNVLLLDVGSFTPSENGLYRMVLTAGSDGGPVTVDVPPIDFQVGPFVTGSVQVAPDVVAVGDPEVEAEVKVTARIATLAQEDPLVALVVDAADRGTAFSAQRALTWDGQGCYGCHVQTQSLVSSVLASDVGVSATSHRMTRIYELVRKFVQPDGSIYPASGYESTPSWLAGWALSYYPMTPSDDTCALGTYCAGTGVCETACTSRADCGEDERCTAAGRCAPVIDAPCIQDNDCADDEHCGSNSQCVRACTDAVDCPAGATCDPRGRCSAPATVACTADSDCGPGYFCGDTSSCTFQCTRDAQCQAGSTCDARGRCAGAQACTSDADCMQGFCGADAQCATACETDADCPAESHCSSHAAPGPTAWATTGVPWIYDIGKRFTVDCPPNGALSTVYGTDVYHPNSSVCSAAVHVGLFTRTSGGSAVIEITRSPANFPGTARNGVTSYSTIAGLAAFKFVQLDSAGRCAAVAENRACMAPGVPTYLQLFKRVVDRMLTYQNPDGTFQQDHSNVSYQPPTHIAYGVIATARAYLFLKEDAYLGAVQRSASWLLSQSPSNRNAFERARLLQAINAALEALRKAGDTSRVEPLADLQAEFIEALVVTQRADGSWTTPGHLDAVATSIVVYALVTTGLFTGRDAAVLNGLLYVLNQQQPDGSWGTLNGGITNLDDTTMVMLAIPELVRAVNALQFSVELDLAANTSLTQSSTEPAQRTESGGVVSYRFDLPGLRDGFTSRLRTNVVLKAMRHEETRPVFQSAHLTYINRANGEPVRTRLDVPSVRGVMASTLTVDVLADSYTVGDPVVIRPQVANLSEGMLDPTLVISVLDDQDRRVDRVATLSLDQPLLTAVAGYDYQVPITITAGPDGMQDAVITQAINLTEALQGAGIQAVVDIDSLRAFQVRNRTLEEVALTFAPDSQFNAGTHAAGTLAIQLPGSVTPLGQRRVLLVFDVAGGGTHAPSTLLPNAGPGASVAWRALSPSADLTTTDPATLTYATGTALKTIQPVLSWALANEGPGSGLPSDRFAAEVHGALFAPDDGPYLFRVESDDGAWLYIDGNLVVNNGGVHTSAHKDAQVMLQRGFHEIRVVYFDATGPASLRVQWRPPSAGQLATIPQRNLHPAALGSAIQVHPATEIPADAGLIHWDSSGRRPGSYSILAEFTATGAPSLSARDAFALTNPPMPPAGSVDALLADILADRESYGPQAPVELLGRVFNPSREYSYPSVLARVQVLAPDDSVVFTREQTVTPLGPEAALPVTPIWNTGTSAPGLYRAVLTALDAMGGVLASAEDRFAIVDAGLNGALVGSITASTRAAAPGVDVVLNGTVGNVGGAALANVAPIIRVLRVSDGLRVGEQAFPSRTLQPAQQDDVTHTLQTNSLTPDDYVALLVNAGRTLATVGFTITGTTTDGGPAGVDGGATGSDGGTSIPPLVLVVPAEANDTALCIPNAVLFTAMGGQGEYTFLGDNDAVATVLNVRDTSGAMVGMATPHAPGVVEIAVVDEAGQRDTYRWQINPPISPLRGGRPVGATFSLGVTDEPEGSAMLPAGYSWSFSDAALVQFNDAESTGRALAPGLLTATLMEGAVAQNPQAVLRFTPVGSLIVRVGSNTGAALAGATVTVSGRVLETDDSGEAAFQGLPIGDHRVTVTSSAHLTSVRENVRVTEGSARQEITLTPAATSLRGSVVDGTGASIAGAQVALQDLVTGRVHPLWTRADGTFAGGVDADPSEPRFVVAAWRDGFLPHADLSTAHAASEQLVVVLSPGTRGRRPPLSPAAGSPSPYVRQIGCNPDHSRVAVKPFGLKGVGSAAPSLDEPLDLGITSTVDAVDGVMGRTVAFQLPSSLQLATGAWFRVEVAYFPDRFDGTTDGLFVEWAPSPGAPFSMATVRHLHAEADVISFETDRAGAFRVRRGIIPERPDAGLPDAWMPDAAMPDAWIPDAAMADAWMPDAAVPDAWMPDAAEPPDAAVTVSDAGVVGAQDAGVTEQPKDPPPEDSSLAGTGCQCGGTTDAPLESGGLGLVCLGWFWTRRRVRGARS